MRTGEVIVIGAGANGLAVAHELHGRGIAARILEKTRRAGDAWHHRHPQLRLNTHRDLSCLPGMRHAAGIPAFPARDDIIRYLDEYARRLRAPVDYGVTVSGIRQSAQGWSVETDAGTYSCRHVVIATGLDRVPFVPEWPGRDDFRGELRHSARFGRIDDYRGKKVLVIGAGNSGSDILNHLAAIDADRVWVSVRRGSVVFPRYLWGIPVQRLSPLMARLPVAAVDAMLALTERLAFGNLREWGLPRPDRGGATRLLEEGIAPAIDDGFVAALKSGRFRVVPRIHRFHAAAVEFNNGEHVEPDVVIAATGYRSGLESILDLPGLLDDRGVPTINGNRQHQSYPGLWFIGMRPRLPGFFYMACKDSREIAQAIAGEARQQVAPPIAELATASNNAVRE